MSPYTTPQDENLADHIDMYWLQNLAREAGKLALSFFRRVKIEKKPDNSIVTEADRQVELFIRKEIRAKHSQHTIIGEEFPADHAKPHAPRFDQCWAIDPIDGTTSFAKGLPTWCISLGYISSGVPMAGVIYMPISDEMHTAKYGQGAFLNGERIQMNRHLAPEDEEFLCVSSKAHIQFDFNYPAKLRSFGSSAAHIAYVARNTSWAALIGRANIWDIAAGAILLHEAGGELQYYKEGRIDYNELYSEQLCPDTILATSPARFDQLRSWITPEQS